MSATTASASATTATMIPIAANALDESLELDVVAFDVVAGAAVVVTPT